jgi:hypothetical protein
MGDDWLDAVLAADRAETAGVDDDGFTRRVLAGLPPAAPRRPLGWIVPAMGGLGIVIGLVALSGAQSLSFGLVELMRPESWSMQKLLAVALPLALLYGLAFDAALRER